MCDSQKSFLFYVAHIVDNIITSAEEIVDWSKRDSEEVYCINSEEIDVDGDDLIFKFDICSTITYRVHIGRSSHLYKKYREAIRRLSRKRRARLL